MRSYKNIIPFFLYEFSKLTYIILPVILLATAFWAYQLKNFKFDGEFTKLLDRPTESGKILKNLYTHFSPQSDDSVLYLKFDKEIPVFSFLTFLESLDSFVSQQSGMKMDSLLNITAFTKTPGGMKKIHPFGPNEHKSEDGKLFTQLMEKHRSFKNIYFEKDSKSFLIRFQITETDSKLQLKSLNTIKNYVHATPFIKTLNQDNIIFYGGPFTADTISKSIEKDLYVLIPLALLFICVLLWKNFSSLKAVVLSLSCISFTLIWTFGLMAFNGIAMSIADVFLPILLLACCASYSIYFLSQFYHALEKSKLSVEHSIKASLYKDYLPLGISILTTAIGFSSFMLCETRSLQIFGRYITLGMLFSAILIFIYLPAAIRVLYIQDDIKLIKERKRKKNSSELLLKFSRRILLFASRYSLIIIIVMVLLFILSLLAYPRLSTDFRITSLYGKESKFTADFAKINDSFAIGADFYLVLESNVPKYFRTDNGVKLMWDVEKTINEQPEVINNLGAPFVLREINSEILENKAPSVELLGDAFLLTSFMDKNPLRNYLSPKYTIARFLVRTKLESAQQLSDMASKIERQVKDRLMISTLAHKDLKVHVISKEIVLNESSELLLLEQKASLIYTSIFVSLCFFLFYRSFKIGFVSFVPNIVPVCFNFVFMWAAGIPLDFSTVLIAASALGISVDDTAHIIDTYLNNLKSFRYHFLKDKLTSAGREDIIHMALYKTFTEVGPPAIRTTFALMGSIGVLCLSSFVMTRHLGLCFAMTLFFCLICDLLLLPALLKRMPL